MPAFGELATPLRFRYNPFHFGHNETTYYGLSQPTPNQITSEFFDSRTRVESKMDRIE